MARPLRPLILAVTALVAVIAARYALVAVDALLVLIPAEKWLTAHFWAHGLCSVLLCLWVVSATFFEVEAGMARWRRWLSQKDVPWRAIIWSVLVALWAIWYFGVGTWLGWRLA